MKRVGLLVVVLAVAMAFAIPAFAGDCGCNKCNTCPKPCVTCSKPCNVIQSTADAVSGIERPCMPCMVNPVTRVAETITPGCGKEKNMLKPWYSCQPCKPCSTCPNTCKSCGKCHTCNK